MGQDFLALKEKNKQLEKEVIQLQPIRERCQELEDENEQLRNQLTHASSTKNKSDTAIKQVGYISRSFKPKITCSVSE